MAFDIIGLFTIIGGFAGAVYLYEVGMRLLRRLRRLPDTADAERLLRRLEAEEQRLTQLLLEEAERLLGRLEGVEQRLIPLLREEADTLEAAMAGIAQEMLGLDLRLQRIEEGVAQLRPRPARPSRRGAA